jgi:hypothetical protein
VAGLLTIRRDERGVGVITALIITLVVFTTGAMWVQTTVHQVEGSGIERSREQALVAAEAGVNAAMSWLAQNGNGACPSTVTSGTLAGVGDWEYSFPQSGDARYVDCTNPTELRRYIIAKGYAPAKTATRVSRRQLEQQVDLLATDGFKYALFASGGGISGANQITVRGDAYSHNPVTIANNSTITGSLTAYAAVTLTGSTLINGRVWANGAVAVNTSGNGSGVQGDVWTSSGGINVDSYVGGNAQAAGAITGSGTVAGSKTPNSPAPTPPDLSLPTYSWASSNYTSPTIWAPPTYSSPGSSFQSYFDSHTNGFGGVHRITTCGSPYSSWNCSPSVAEINLGTKWDMNADTTIVSDGKINISRDIKSGTGNLVVVSGYPGTPCTTPGDSCNAIKLTNNWTIPSSVKVMLFAQNGCVDVSNLKTFVGAIYARCINLDNNFDLTYYPLAPVGFDWSTATSTHFTIQARSFREVPFGS